MAAMPVREDVTFILGPLGPCFPLLPGLDPETWAVLGTQATLFPHASYSNDDNKRQKIDDLQGFPVSQHNYLPLSEYVQRYPTLLIAESQPSIDIEHSLTDILAFSSFLQRDVQSRYEQQQQRHHHHRYSYHERTGSGSTVTIRSNRSTSSLSSPTTSPLRIKKELSQSPRKQHTPTLFQASEMESWTLSKNTTVFKLPEQYLYVSVSRLNSKEMESESLERLSSPSLVILQSGRGTMRASHGKDDTNLVEHLLQEAGKVFFIGANVKVDLRSEEDKDDFILLRVFNRIPAR